MKYKENTRIDKFKAFSHKIGHFHKWYSLNGYKTHRFISDFKIKGQDFIISNTKDIRYVYRTI